MDENREVVLYTIDLKALLENNNSDFHVIGFQALPRPDAQKAYSLFVSHKHNFNICPFINYKKFRVNRKQSEKYFEMFEGGAKLFPNDVVDEMACEIRQSMEIDREVLEVCFREKMGSSLPLTLINFEQGSKADLTPFFSLKFQERFKFIQPDI